MSLQIIIRDTAPAAQPLDDIVFGPGALDGPGPDDLAEDVEEVFCLACQLPVAAFESHGGDLLHYVGDPVNDNIMPIEVDHAPFLP